MTIKTFRAATLQQALELVVAELGENAQVLHTRQVDEPRFFGILRRRFVEITAASRMTPDWLSPSVEFSHEKQGGKAVTKHSSDDFVQKILKSPYEQSLPIAERKPSEPTLSDPVSARGALRTGTTQVSAFQGLVPRGPWQRLEMSDINPTLLQQNLQRHLEKMMPIAGPLDFSLAKKGPLVVALVGTTGVGKTATLAKLAAHYRLREFKQVGFLTTDVQKLGAVEPLRQYAEMFDAPLEIVTDIYRAKTALSRLRDRHLVLVDTPGTNPNNETKMNLLNAWIETLKVDEVHLLLSTTSSASVLENSFQKFMPLGLTGIILTKIDEAVGISELYRFFAATQEKKIPYRFFATGRNITDDLELAGFARLVTLLDS